MKKSITPQQDRFRQAVRFLCPLRKLIAKNFGKHNKMTNFNQAVSVAVSQAFRSSPSGEQVLDPSRILISNGSLDTVEVLELKCKRNSVEVIFSDIYSRINANADDQVFLCVYAPELCLADVSGGVFERSGCRVDISLIPVLQDVPLLLYLYCRDRNGKYCSRSEFLGCIGKEGNYVTG